MIQGGYPRQGQGKICVSPGVLTLCHGEVETLSLNVTNKVCLLPAAHQFRNLIYHWVRDLMFFTSSSSLSACLVPWCPLMSTWHQRFFLGAGSSWGVHKVLREGWSQGQQRPSWLPLLIGHRPFS